MPRCVRGCRVRANEGRIWNKNHATPRAWPSGASKTKRHAARASEAYITLANGPDAARNNAHLKALVFWQFVELMHHRIAHAGYVGFDNQREQHVYFALVIFNFLCSRC